MNVFLQDKNLQALLVLFGLTVLAWLAPMLLTVPPVTLGFIVLLVAFVKVRLIMMRFMELHEVYPPLRYAFDAWALVAGGGTIFLYLYL